MEKNKYSHMPEWCENEVENHPSQKGSQRQVCDIIWHITSARIFGHGEIEFMGLDLGKKGKRVKKGLKWSPFLRDQCLIHLGIWSQGWWSVRTWFLDQGGLESQLHPMLRERKEKWPSSIYTSKQMMQASWDK